MSCGQEQGTHWALSSAIQTNGKYASVWTIWLGPEAGFNIFAAQSFSQVNCQLPVWDRKDADYLGQTLLLFVSEQYPWLHLLPCNCGLSLALSPQFPGLSLNHRNSALRQLLGQSLMAGKSTVLQTLRHCKYWKKINLCCIFWHRMPKALSLILSGTKNYVYRWCNLLFSVLWPSAEIPSGNHQKAWKALLSLVTPAH